MKRFFAGLLALVMVLAVGSCLGECEHCVNGKIALSECSAKTFHDPEIKGQDLGAICLSCGKISLAEAEYATCKICKGVGYAVCDSCKGTGIRNIFGEIMGCVYCDGKGYDTYHKCTSCDGTGKRLAQYKHFYEHCGMNTVCCGCYNLSLKTFDCPYCSENEYSTFEYRNVMRESEKHVDGEFLLDGTVIQIEETFDGAHKYTLNSRGNYQFTVYCDDKSLPEKILVGDDEQVYGVMIGYNSNTDVPAFFPIKIERLN